MEQFLLHEADDFCCCRFGRHQLLSQSGFHGMGIRVSQGINLARLIAIFWKLVTMRRQKNGSAKSQKLNIESKEDVI